MEPGLHQVGGESGLFVGAKWVGDHELAEGQPGAVAIMAEYLGSQSLGQSVGGKVGKPLGACTLAAFEYAASQQDLAASGGPESFEDGGQVVVLFRTAPITSKSGLLYCLTSAA